MHRRTLAALLPLVAAAAVSGCGGGGDGGAKEPSGNDEQKELLDSVDTRPRDVDDSDEEIKQLLADRAAALEQRDAKVLRATATGAQRKRDERALANLDELPLERVRLEPGELQISGRRATMQAGMAYRVKGASRAFLTSRKVVARRSAAGWRIVRDVPRHDALPWEVERYTATTGRNVVLLTPPEVQPGTLMPGLQAAYGKIARDLPARDLPERVLVIAARDAGQVKRLDGNGINGGVVAMASVFVDYKPGGALEVQRVLSQRMTIVMDRYDRMPEQEREWTLAHEMVHTAMNPDTSGRTPQWIIEGVAMYVSGEDLSGYTGSVAGDRPSLTELSKRDAIANLSDSDAQGAAYVVASAAAEEIAERKGNKGLFRFYEAFNDSTITGPPGPRTTDKVLRKSVGMSLRELDAAIG
ncbi:MAG: hypothetical protein ABW060_05600 [Solirubrobacteraceae bacterium]